MANLDRERPLGISIVAASLLLASPVLVVSGIRAIVSTMELIRRTPGQGGSEILIAVSVCPVILGIACAISGFDLWRLRRRGRAPAIFEFCLFAFFAANLALINVVDKVNANRAQSYGEWATCAFCVWGVGYLCLPGIRRRFKSDQSAVSDKR